MRQITLVNGPPRCGKDTVGRVLAWRFRVRIDKFARKLKESAHALYGQPTFAHDALEHCKDEPCELFLGKTPREVYIALSETYFKPLYGEDIFGRMLVEDLVFPFQQGQRIVITDSGFVPEAEVLLERFGADYCQLIRVHRRGCDFANDSRGYIELADIKTVDVHNDGTVAELAETITELAG